MEPEAWWIWAADNGMQHMKEPVATSQYITVLQQQITQKVNEAIRSKNIGAFIAKKQKIVLHKIAETGAKEERQTFLHCLNTICEHIAWQTLENAKEPLIALWILVHEIEDTKTRTLNSFMCHIYRYIRTNEPTLEWMIAVLYANNNTNKII